MINKKRNLAGLLAECGEGGGGAPSINISIVNKFKPEVEYEVEAPESEEEGGEEEGGEEEAPEEGGAEAAPEEGGEADYCPDCGGEVCPHCGGHMDDHGAMESRLKTGGPLWTEGKSWRK